MKIIKFISPALDSNNDKTLKFIDLLGCENFRFFNKMIEELEIGFLKNEITIQEINSIKKLILNKKGLLEIII